MREIKFRVWCKKRKCWLTPNDYSLHCESNWMMDIFTGEIIDYLKSSEGIEPTPEPTSYYDENKIIKCSPFVKQQYTGFKDKDGDDIYEGDILNYKIRFYDHGDVTDTTGEVYWQDGSFLLDGTYQLDMRYEVPTHMRKIIGNIFEGTTA
jgi:hypothetical protein